MLKQDFILSVNSEDELKKLLKYTSKGNDNELIFNTNSFNEINNDAFLKEHTIFEFNEKSKTVWVKIKLIPFLGSFIFILPIIIICINFAFKVSDILETVAILIGLLVSFYFIFKYITDLKYQQIYCLIIEILYYAKKE